MTLWIVTIAALVIAVLAFAQARRTARQLSQITEMYWQLKFDHGELKAKVDPSTPPAPEPKQTFVPLTSLRPEAKAAPGFGGAGSPQDK